MVERKRGQRKRGGGGRTAAVGRRRTGGEIGTAARRQKGCFRSEFFNHESDEENYEADMRNEIKEIVIDDMDPIVFKVCFYFFSQSCLPFHC